MCEIRRRATGALQCVERSINMHYSVCADVDASVFFHSLFTPHLRRKKVNQHVLMK